jgi:predicted small lipoprotein YifL
MRLGVKTNLTRSVLSPSLLGAVLWLANSLAACGQNAPVDLPIVAQRSAATQPTATVQASPAEGTTAAIEANSTPARPTPNSGPAAPVGGKERSLPELRAPDLSTTKVGTGKTPKDEARSTAPQPEALPWGPTRDVPPVPSTKFWAPTAICHNPLYFEDAMLERHGHERFPCVQPFASGVRFVATAVTLPYLITLHPPCEDVYALGHWRPGSQAPCLVERAPYDHHALKTMVLTSGAAAVAIP